MRKLSGEMKRRILMTLFGVFIMGMSVGLFSLAALGMDPFQSLAHGIWRNTRISFGSCYTIICVILIVLVFFINRKKIGLGTVINLFLVGYVADFSEWLFGKMFPHDTMPEKIILLAAALLVMCFSSAFYFSADLGVSVYDALALTVAERTTVPFRVCRIVSDLICVAVGGLLCYVSDHDLSTGGALLQTVGAGTVITAFFMGPLISFFQKKVADPLRYGSRKDGK